MKLVKTKVDGFDFWYREDDKFIGQRISLGKYEQFETALMKSQINSTSVCVDVGANIGYYTLLMAKRARKVFAFEPDGECFKILEKNVKENNLKNVELFNIAIGNKKEKKYLIRDCENFGNSRVDDKNGLLINTVTLDNVLKNEQKIDVVKIDTQGWESEVVEGAKKILKKDKPTLFLEYTPSEYEDKKMINFLKNTYQDIWSINDFASVPWPIYKGIKIVEGCEYTDLFLKSRMNLKDYVEMIKNVKYKKFIRGIMGLLCQK